MEQNLKKLIERIMERENQEEEWQRMIREDYPLVEEDRQWEGWVSPCGLTLSGTQAGSGFITV